MAKLGRGQPFKPLVQPMKILSAGAAAVTFVQVQVIG